jgi:indolepyruvate ferredoxin oxidoreductase alpha subunit
MGNTVLGYGLSLASAAGVAPNFGKRVISVMGDGGFWHNGLTTGVIGAQFNQSDQVLLLVQNGYTSGTGQQLIPSSPSHSNRKYKQLSIDSVLRGLGVRWIRKVHTYHVRDMVKALREALTTKEGGLKVIEAEGECMLARQRRFKPWFSKRLAAGERVVKSKYGVDEDVCTGDHSCIRLSGCPSLTIKPSSDPLRLDPVAAVDSSCVACGLCGEVAQAAALCPSFYRADRVHHAGWFERVLYRTRRSVIGMLQRIAGEDPLLEVA